MSVVLQGCDSNISPPDPQRGCQSFYKIWDQDIWRCVFTYHIRSGKTRGCASKVSNFPQEFRDHGVTERYVTTHCISQFIQSLFIMKKKIPVWFIILKVDNSVICRHIFFKSVFKKHSLHHAFSEKKRH